MFLTLAAAYQGAWKVQKCSKYCHLGEQELSKLLLQPSLSSSAASTSAVPEFVQPASPESYLKVCRHLVTLKFQHCAILSQLNSHEKAL